jgi:hypothetical protein
VVGAVYGDPPTGHVAVIDLSDPVSPAVTDLPSIPYDLNLHRSRLSSDGLGLAVLHPNGVSSFDLTDALHPAPLGTAPFDEQFQFTLENIELAGDVLYGIQRERRTDYLPPFESRLVTEIVAFDVSDVGQPNELGRIEVPMDDSHYRVSLETRGSYLYFVGGMDLLTVIDTQDPSAMSIAAVVPRSETMLPAARHLYLDGGLAFVGHFDPANGADLASIAIVDVTNPEDPVVLIENIRTDGIHWISGADAHLLYTTWTLHGQDVDGFDAIAYDISDPTQPSEVGGGNVTLGMDVAGAPQSLFDGGLIFVSGDGNVYVMPRQCPQAVPIADDSPDPVTRQPGPDLRLSVSPNPFNPAVEVRFTTPRAGSATVEVYSVAGRRIATLVQGPVESGDHMLTWNGTDASGKPVSSGVYLFRLRTRDRITTARATLLE